MVEKSMTPEELESILLAKPPSVGELAAQETLQAIDDSLQEVAKEFKEKCETFHTFMPLLVFEAYIEAIREQYRTESALNDLGIEISERVYKYRPRFTIQLR